MSWRSCESLHRWGVMLGLDLIATVLASLSDGFWSLENC